MKEEILNLGQKSSALDRGATVDYIDPASIVVSSILPQFLRVVVYTYICI